MTGDRPEDFDDLAARSRDRALRDAEAIADVESALAQVRSGNVVPTAAGSSSGRRRVVLAAAALVAVVSVSAVLWLSRDTDEQFATSPVTAPTEPPPGESTIAPTTAPPATEPPTTEPLTTEPPTTEPGLDDEVVVPCRSVPVAPPALVDGSGPGDAVVIESDESRSAVWGEGSFYAITQGLDVDVDSDNFGSALGVVVGDHEGRVLPVGDPPLGGMLLFWRDPAGCDRLYRLDSGFMVEEALDYLSRWLTSVDTGQEFVIGFAPAFDAPSEYVAVRLVQSQFDDVRRFGPDGTDLGSHPDVASFPDERLPQGAQLADGRRLSPARYDSGARCVNEPVTIDGEPLHPGLDVARSINSTPDGLVIATRDVCPDGASWGDPGSRWELVRLDFRQPDTQVEILLTRDPDPDAADDGSHSARTDGNAGVSAISPGGRLVALGQYTGGEQTEWTIRSLDTPDVVIDPPSRCTDPGPLVAAPEFVTDQRAVVARSCLDSGTETLHIETVALDSGEVDHSVEVGDLAEWSEFRYVSISSIVDDDDIWTIVSIRDLDRATTAVLIRSDSATDITQPGYRTYAFTIDDLARR